MSKTTAIHQSGLCLLTLVLLIGYAPHAAATPLQTLCFQKGAPLLGGWSTIFRLQVPPLAEIKRNQIVAVHALEQGSQPTFPVNSYSNELTGTATYTLVNGGLGNGYEIQISLLGASYGTPNYGDTANKGLYNASYSLRLHKKSLNGRIIGTKQYTPASDPSATKVSYIDDTLTLLPECPAGL
ncbi:MAG: hypothetical protein EPN21_17800 [Methylococcaceae bacterium]|nr:MAG: hypothetical protein EPN21_17800 [Methylococcaceae bacterium]